MPTYEKSILIFLATLSPENNEGNLLHVLHGVYVCCKTRDIACISELTHFKCVIGTVEHILYCLRLFNDTVRDPNTVLPTPQENLEQILHVVLTQSHPSSSPAPPLYTPLYMRQLAFRASYFCSHFMILPLIWLFTPEL